MAEVRCYHCGNTRPAVPTKWLRCVGCGRQVHVAAAQQVAAAERLIEQARGEAHLDEDVRQDLVGRLGRYRRDVLTAAAALPQPPSLEEPAPRQEPPPKPRTESQPDPVPEPMADRPSEQQPASQSVPPSVPTPTAGSEVAAAVAAPRDRAVPPRAPGLWSRLGPVFAENLLFALAGFLLVAGAVYFTTTAWTTMSGSTQKLVVAGGLLVFAAMTHAAAVALSRGRGLATAARVLSLVGLALAPAAAVVAGRMFVDSPARAVATAAAATAVAHFVLLAMVRRERCAIGSAAPWLNDLLVFGGVFTVALVDVRLATACGAAAALLLAAWSQRRVYSAAAAVPAAGFCVLAALTFSAMALLIGLGLAHGGPLWGAIAPLGVVVAAAALAVCVLEQASSARMPTALTAAFSVAIGGVAMASGDVRSLMVAAWCAAAVGMAMSWRMDRARLLIPALGLSAIGYLFLPAPIRELAMRLRAEAASQLGYAPQRLPLSFYGITFLPYLAGLALLGMWFRRRGRARHRRVTSGWAMTVATGLAGMSLLLGDDLRAPMVVLPADGALLVLLGYLAGSAAAVLAGCLFVLGGVVCALAWAAAPPGVVTAVGAAATTLLFWLGRARDAAIDPAADAPAGAVDAATAEAAANADAGFAPRGRRSYRLAGGIALVALSVWLIVCAWPPGRSGVRGLLHATALVPVWMAWRTRWLRTHGGAAAALLPLPALWGTAVGVACLLEVLGLPGSLELPGSSAARAAMPAGLGLVTALASLLLRPLSTALPATRAVRVLVCGLFALQAFLLLDLLAGYRTQWQSWTTIGGTAVLAVGGMVLAWRARTDVLLAIAVVCLGFPLHLLTWRWSGDPAVAPALAEGLLGPALLGPALLVPTAAWFAPRRRAVAVALGGLAVALALVLVARRLELVPLQPTPVDAATALVSCLLLAVVPLRGASRWQPRTGVHDLAWVAAGTVVAMAAPILLLDLLVDGLAGYCAGLLALAALPLAAAAWSRRVGPRVALGLAGHGLWLVALALVLAFAWRPVEVIDDRWRLGAFLVAGLLAAACRPRALRTAATIVALVAAFGAAVLQPIELGWVAERWSGVSLLALCAAALFATASPRFAARANGVLWLAIPVVSIAALVQLVTVLLLAAQEAARPPGDAALFDATMLAFLLAALGLAAHSRSRWRPYLAWTAASITLFGTTPVNGLLHGHRDVFFRPDVEAALMALAVAVRGRLHPLGAGWALVAVAVSCTAFDLGDPSTPMTASLAAGVPLVLLLRGRGDANAVGHGALLLLATWSWIVWAGRGGAVFVGAWFGLAAALLGAVIGAWLKVAARRDLEPQVTALRTAFGVVSLSMLVAWCLRAPVPLPTPELGAALASCAVVAVGAARTARARGREAIVHLALLAGAVAYLLVVRGTELLAPLDGRHHHALTVIGVSLFLAAGRAATPLRRQLFGAAIVAPLVAVLAATVQGGLTFSLLSAAVAMGLGAVLTRARALAALALALANSGLFHLWLTEGMFDPSFYGVPAGLSLVFGAELARQPLGEARVMALRVAGLSVLYGSVLVQVARVSVPMHALLLFAAAMAAVAFGALRRQAPILITGTVAVVLDVVAYLAQRGFEQDFLGSVLLVGAGCALFVVAARAARRRARGAPPAG